MSRSASGNDEVLAYAREAIATAQVKGVSPGWACQLRRRFMRGQLAGAVNARTARGRKRQNMSRQEEQEFLAPSLEQAAAGGVLVISPVKAALGKRLARAVALAPATPPQLDKIGTRQGPSTK